jgi:hypothetical protein
LFRHVDGYPDRNAFITTLRDQKRGSEYRRVAGIAENIPTEGTFSNFRKRIGEARYNHIFHVLVDIFHQLEMISFSILAHDGTLYPSWARYKGCTYFCSECSRITVQNVREKVRQRILYRLDNMPKNGLGKDIRVHAECPSDRFPKDVKKPKIELFSCRLAFSSGEPTQEQINTAIISTSVEPQLGIELPVAVSNIAGNAEEGDHLIINKEQIRKHHNCKPAVDCLDSKYDSIKNYSSPHIYPQFHQKCFRAFYQYFSAFRVRNEPWQIESHPLLY